MPGRCRGRQNNIFLYCVFISNNKHFLNYFGHANPWNLFLFERAETVRDVIEPVSGDSILMSKQSMHAALLGAARAYLAL